MATFNWWESGKVAVLVCYFDEVKPEDKDQPYYWLGGLMVSDDALLAVDSRMRDLAEECFGEGHEMSTATEFHATNICSRSKNFKSWSDPGKRFDVLKRLARIVNTDGVFRVVVRLTVEDIAKSVNYENLAFMFLVERINAFARGKKTHALLIGDMEHQIGVNQAVSNLSRYRDSGTDYEYGQAINNVVDTVHFAQSHHSRLLQLADTYMWIEQLLHRDEKTLSSIRADFVKFVHKEIETSPHKYKFWPRQRSSF